MVVLASIAACGSTESRAEDDARGLIRERLTDIEGDLAASLTSFNPSTDDAASLAPPSTYRQVVDRGRVTIEFGVRAVGRDGLTVGETTIAGGACFRVVGIMGGGTIRQVGCPRSFLREPGRPVETELEIVDSVRPLKSADRRPSFPFSGG